MKHQYCCETMQSAIQDWGGIWWDKEKQSWRMPRTWLDDDHMTDKEISECPWCKAPLKKLTEQDDWRDR